MALVQLSEAVGSDQNEIVISTLVLFAQDRHSDQLYNYAPLIPGANPAVTTYSYERWVRMRFSSGYSTVDGFRFWSPGLIVPDGWELLWGTTSSYATPINTASAIATGALPTSDPGESSPNLGGGPLTGPGTTYSDWIVLQARAVGGTQPGPMLGFDRTGTARSLDFEFRWNELD